MATISAVRIANLALSHLGQGTSIETLDFNIDNSPEAYQAGLWYDFAKEQVLVAYDWSFARFRETLVDHADDPPDGIWAYRYVYPVNCLVMREIENSAAPPGDASPFVVEMDLAGTEKTILTNVDDATGIYTRKITDTSLFSPFFVITLSYLLAHYMAMGITGRRKDQQEMIANFAGMIRLAPAHDANEMVEGPPREAESIRGRI